jgi:hypothetical protein
VGHKTFTVLPQRFKDHQCATVHSASVLGFGHAIPKRVHSTEHRNALVDRGNAALACMKTKVLKTMV